MKLSLCLAVFNEEGNIHYPLDSACNLADEIIIVDGGSTDKTIEIAKSYGPKVQVFIEDNPPMFHINKQKAIKRAKGDWILQLDADETLSEELKKEVKKITSSALDKKPVAYWIPRKNYFLGRFLMKGGQYPDYTIRLYRNGVAEFPCQDVHENVKVRGKAGYLKNPILHYADFTFSRYLMRWKRYNDLDAEILAKRSAVNVGFLQQLVLFVRYIFIKPAVTFFSIYFRHLGFLDGWQGFVFAFFSSVRFWAVYARYVIKRLF